MSELLSFLSHLLPSWAQPWWPDAAAFGRMGRHGAYVWPAVFLCGAALTLEAWQLRRATRRAGLGVTEAGAGRRP